MKPDKCIKVILAGNGKAHKILIGHVSIKNMEIPHRFGVKEAKQNKKPPLPRRRAENVENIQLHAKGREAEYG